MVLEALACEVPVVVRDIPVYEGWLEDGDQVCKASDREGFYRKLRQIFSEDCSARKASGRRLAEEHGILPTGRLLEAVCRKEKIIWKKESIRDMIKEK